MTESGHCDVSLPNGTFSIDRLPAGTYTVTAWHEVYGEKKAEVTIVDGQPAKVEFTYSAADGT